MICYAGKRILSDSEKAEIREAVMMVPEKYRFDKYTIIFTNVEELLIIIWRKRQDNDPVEKIVIKGGTAKALHDEFGYALRLDSFLKMFYKELYDEITKQ